VPDPRDARARLVRGAAIPVAARIVADVEDEWTRHLGRQRIGQLRRALEALREITDPYA
jgi:hypothetical protein